MTIRLLLLNLFFAAAVFGSELTEALKTVDAPAEEFVQMPAKYIFQKLERQAHRSGIPVLGGFAVECRMAGIADRRLNLGMEKMNLMQALMAVASATGTHLEFEGTKAILIDPAKVVVEPEEEEELSNINRIQGEKVTFSDIDTALVFVETGAGSGSAFVAEMGGKIYLISNQHNFVGASKLELKSMTGELIEFMSFEFCKSRDLVRFEIDPEKLGTMGVLAVAEASPTIGESVVVYGNSAGGNVATELKGKILGVGPEDVELDAKIVSGNSGSPVLNAAGEVIGVATYVAFERKFSKNDVRKQIYKGTRFSKVRRYGVRIPDDGWQQVDIWLFLDQSYTLADLRSYLEIMNILVQYWNANVDYKEAAEEIISRFSSASGSRAGFYEFHSAKTEQEVQMMVKSFARNYDEFVQLVQKEDLDREELNALSNEENDNAESKIERSDNYIRTSLLNRAKRTLAEQEDLVWMSKYLKDEAAPYEKMLNDLIRTLEGKKNIYLRVKAVM